MNIISSDAGEEEFRKERKEWYEENAPVKWKYNYELPIINPPTHQDLNKINLPSLKYKFKQSITEYSTSTSLFPTSTPTSTSTHTSIYGSSYDSYSSYNPSPVNKNQKSADFSTINKSIFLDKFYLPADIDSINSPLLEASDIKISDENDEIFLPDSTSTSFKSSTAQSQFNSPNKQDSRTNTANSHASRASRRHMTVLTESSNSQSHSQSYSQSQSHSHSRSNQNSFSQSYSHSTNQSFLVPNASEHSTNPSFFVPNVNNRQQNSFFLSDSTSRSNNPSFFGFSKSQNPILLPSGFNNSFLSFSSKSLLDTTKVTISPTTPPPLPLISLGNPSSTGVLFLTGLSTKSSNTLLNLIRNFIEYNYYIFYENSLFLEYKKHLNSSSDIFNKNKKTSLSENIIKKSKSIKNYGKLLCKHLICKYNIKNLIIVSISDSTFLAYEILYYFDYYNKTLLKNSLYKTNLITIEGMSPLTHSLYLIEYINKLKNLEIKIKKAKQRGIKLRKKERNLGIKVRDYSILLYGKTFYQWGLMNQARYFLAPKDNETFSAISPEGSSVISSIPHLQSSNISAFSPVERKNKKKLTSIINEGELLKKFSDCGPGKELKSRILSENKYLIESISYYFFSCLYNVKAASNLTTSTNDFLALFSTLSNLKNEDDDNYYDKLKNNDSEINEALRLENEKKYQIKLKNFFNESLWNNEIEEESLDLDKYIDDNVDEDTKLLSPEDINAKVIIDGNLKDLKFIDNVIIIERDEIDGRSYLTNSRDLLVNFEEEEEEEENSKINEEYKDSFLEQDSESFINNNFELNSITSTPQKPSTTNLPSYLVNDLSLQNENEILNTQSSFNNTLNSIFSGNSLNSSLNNNHLTNNAESTEIKGTMSTNLSTTSNSNIIVNTEDNNDEIIDNEEDDDFQEDWLSLCKNLRRIRVKGKVDKIASRTDLYSSPILLPIVTLLAISEEDMKAMENEQKSPV